MVSTTHASNPRQDAPLASEKFWETNWGRFCLALAAGTSIPAAILAPIVQWAAGFSSGEFGDFSGFMGYLHAAYMLVVVFGISTLTALLLSNSEYFKRQLYRVDLFAHGVELRDGRGGVLGETTDGSLRLLGINLRFGRQMIGALRLDHRGGTMYVISSPPVAPTPNLPAVGGYWRSVPANMYQGMLRFVS